MERLPMTGRDDWRELFPQPWYFARYNLAVLATRRDVGTILGANIGLPACSAA